MLVLVFSDVIIVSALVDIVYDVVFNLLLVFVLNLELMVCTLCIHF